MVVAMLVVALGCAGDELLTVTAGNVVTVNRIQSDAFASIEVEDGVEMYLLPGDSDTMRLEMPAGFLGHFTTNVIGGRLFIGLQDHVSPAGFDPRRLWLTVAGLERVIASGGTSITATDSLAYPYLRLTTSGGCRVQMFNVSVNSMEVVASGGSTLEVFARDSLRVVASGGDEVRYRGRPRITQDLSGGSRLVDAN
jgi:hypothetical protein